MSRSDLTLTERLAPKGADYARDIIFQTTTHQKRTPTDRIKQTKMFMNGNYNTEGKTVWAEYLSKLEAGDVEGATAMGKEEK